MSKAAKFQMVDPTEGGLIQQMMHQEVNDRMGKAVEDLAEKYAKNPQAGAVETSENGPTGAAYKAQNAERAAARQEQQRQSNERARAEAEAKMQRAEEIATWEAQQAGAESDDDDEELLRELEEGDDHELQKLREARIAEMRKARNQHMENMAKGHGQYREIVQDEFLPEVTGSLRVICHFYHREFTKCQVMDMHLERIAQRHAETKFIKINAEKAPFFVQKLAIRTLPTAVYFVDGVATERQVGFEGIRDTNGEGAEETFPTENLERRLGEIGAIDYIAPPSSEEYRELYGKQMAHHVTAGLQELSMDDDCFTGDINQA